jgi:hypothetical protein
LPRNSEARANKLYTLDSDLIKQKLTSLTPRALMMLVELVKTVV